MAKDRHSVLVVDDETELLNLVQQALEDDFDIYCCHNGKQTLEMLARVQPDMVLLDVGLPDTNGYEICSRIKSQKQFRDLPILFISGSHTLEERLKGYEVGGHDYISKPFQLKEIRAKLEHTSRMRSEQKQLEAKATDAKHTALQAMTDTSEYGEILHFIKDSFHANGLEDLAKRTLETAHKLGVNCAVQLRGKHQLVTKNSRGEATPLEQELFQSLRSQSRIVDFRNRSIYNYPRVSLLCKNMPLDDAISYGRLKDLLATLVEACEARMINLEKSETLKDVLTSVKGALTLVEGKFTEHEKATSEIMENLMVKMHEGFSVLGLTEDQENFFMELLDSSMSTLVGLYSGEVEINRQFNHITQQINQSLDQN